MHRDYNYLDPNYMPASWQAWPRQFRCQVCSKRSIFANQSFTAKLVQKRLPFTNFCCSCCLGWAKRNVCSSFFQLSVFSSFPFHPLSVVTPILLLRIPTSASWPGLGTFYKNHLWGLFGNISVWKQFVPMFGLVAVREHFGYRCQKYIEQELSSFRLCKMGERVRRRLFQTRELFGFTPWQSEALQVVKLSQVWGFIEVPKLTAILSYVFFGRWQNCLPVTLWRNLFVHKVWI